MLHVDAEGNKTTKNINSFYTMSIASDFTSATVTLNEALPVGEKITLLQSIPNKQESDFVNHDGSPSDLYEKALDLAALRDQQLEEKVARSVKLDETSTVLTVTLKDPVANKGLKFSADGQSIESTEVDADTIVSEAQAAKTAALAAQAAAEAAVASIPEGGVQTGAEISTLLYAEDDTNKYTDAEKTKLSGIATGATANSPNATLLNRSNHTGSQTASTISDFNTAADARITAQKGQNNGIATLDSSGKVPTGQIPAILNDVFTVANETAQLELDADQGDFAIRTDENKTYVHNGGSAGTMADWSEFLFPASPVNSVNGATGNVSLDSDDISEGSTNLYFTGDERTKLDGVEANATADMTGAEIKTAYEGEADTNAFTNALKSKLDGIASGATANSPNATLLNRSNHTGSQTASTISDFNSAADARITEARGAANGVASLDGDTLIPIAQLPIVTEAKGGHGASTYAGGFENMSPLSAKGQIITHNGTTNAALGAPTLNQYLRGNPAAANGIEWGTPPGPYFDIRDYGATGSGDDTSAIQAAVAAALVNGGVVYFPPGVWRISSPIIITYDYTTFESRKRVSLLGAGTGLTLIQWIGTNQPNTFMFKVTRPETSDNVGFWDFTRMEGFTLIHGSAGVGSISGIELNKRAYTEWKDIHFRGLNVPFKLDQVINSKFERLHTTGNVEAAISIGAPSSTLTGPYANNALTFIDCKIGAGQKGGIHFKDTGFIFIGGSIESNGQSATAGTGYGAKIEDTGESSCNVSHFIGTYFEGNGGTGNLGINSSVADAWIIHNSTADNLLYKFDGCTFNRLSASYNPHSIYIDKTSSTAASLSIDNCGFTSYEGYIASSSREVVKLTSYQNVNLQWSCSNYVNNGNELPSFAKANTSDIPQPNLIGVARNRVFSATAIKGGAQTIATSVEVALIWNGTILNDGPMWSAGSPTRLTVPTGVSKVKLNGNIEWDAFTAVTGNQINIFIKKNGVGFPGMPLEQKSLAASTLNWCTNISTGVLPVSPGDYFELFVIQNTGTSKTITSANRNWFTMEIVE
jgi:hypothetical protein